MSLTYETAQWADGPRLYAWLREKGVNPHHYGAMGRRATDWRRGSAADFYTVDRLLTAAGLHAHEAPESMWREAPRPARRVPPKRKRSTNPGGGRALSAEQVELIRREMRMGTSTRGELAARFGVTIRTVSNAANGWTYREVAA